MGFKSVDEMKTAIKSYAVNFENPVPAFFDVHTDYLTDKLDEKSFCEGYEAYRIKMRTLQTYMSERPVDFGLVVIDKKGMEKPAYSMFNQYIWVFLALALSGEAVNGVLNVSGSLFNEYKNKKAVGKNVTIPKNINMLIERLNDVGFSIDGDINGDFTIKSDNPYLLPVIKASSLSLYAGVSIMSDYPCFNHRMYKYGINEKLPFEETHTYQIMNDKQKEFSSKLVNGLAEKGWKTYVFFPSDPYGGRLTYPTIEYYYRASGEGSVLVRVENPLNIKDYVEGLPEKYKEIWERSLKCSSCGGRKECKSRMPNEVLFDKKAMLCYYAKIHFPCETEYVPHIIEAAMITAKRNKKLK